MLTSNFKGFAELLNSNQVEYLVVGGYARRMAVPVDGVELRFISMQNFRINKKAVGRLQDLADLQALDRLTGS